MTKSTFLEISFFNFLVFAILHTSSIEMFFKAVFVRPSVPGGPDGRGPSVRPGWYGRGPSMRPGYGVAICVPDFHVFDLIFGFSSSRASRRKSLRLLLVFYFCDVFFRIRTNTKNKGVRAQQWKWQDVLNQWTRAST